jgi:hypothetical protein
MFVISSFQLKNMLTAVAQEAAHLVSLNNSGVNSPNPSNNINNTGSGLINKNFGFSTNPFTQQVVFSGPGMTPCGNTYSHNTLPMQYGQQQQQQQQFFQQQQPQQQQQVQAQIHNTGTIPRTSQQQQLYQVPQQHAFNPTAPSTPTATTQGVSPSTVSSSFGQDRQFKPRQQRYDSPLLKMRLGKPASPPLAPIPLPGPIPLPPPKPSAPAPAVVGSDADSIDAFPDPPDEKPDGATSLNY